MLHNGSRGQVSRKQASKFYDTPCTYIAHILTKLEYSNTIRYLLSRLRLSWLSLSSIWPEIQKTVQENFRVSRMPFSCETLTNFPNLQLLSPPHTDAFFILAVNRLYDYISWGRQCQQLSRAFSGACPPKCGTLPRQSVGLGVDCCLNWTIKRPLLLTG